MNGIIEGTLKRYEDAAYTASVAFGLAFTDYLKENKDSEAELRINLNKKSDPINGGVGPTILHMTLNETYDALIVEGKKLYKSGLNLVTPQIDFNVVCDQKIFLPLDKIVYISDKPLYSPTAPPQGKVDCAGGPTAGTYILACFDGFGLALHWIGQSFADTMLELCDSELATC